MGQARLQLDTRKHTVGGAAAYFLWNYFSASVVKERAQETFSE